MDCPAARPSWRTTRTISATSPKVLGAHMLEICPSIAGGKPTVRDSSACPSAASPTRCGWYSRRLPGPAVNVSIVDIGSRFRMIVNEVDVVAPDEPLPKLPVARALWAPRPDLATAATAWIYAGGAHHTAFTQAISSEPIRDFAGMAGSRFLSIDQNTRVHEFRNELRWNDAYYSNRIRRNDLFGVDRSTRPPHAFAESACPEDSRKSAATLPES